ncbi:MAG: 2OG-Fe(II) oxygenase [Chloroflexota bacterium]
MESILTIAERIERLDWHAIESSLWQYGCAETPPLLSPEECSAISAMYDEPQRFRKRVDMARHSYGLGEYQYFANPLPDIVGFTRTSLYSRLSPIAERWEQALGHDVTYPEDLDAFLSECHAAGQIHPTPLLLRYPEGGYNCLHQDLYGDVWFPLQVTAFLSDPEVDCTGGEFLLVEQRPRAQSVGQCLQPPQGSMVVFATRYRPVRSARGYSRANVRHGVSRIRSGERATLGIIFHDAR